MKKRFRKMFAVVAATMLVLAMGMVSVNAAENDVEARARLCPICGVGMTTVKKYVKSEYANVACIHGKPNGYDRVYRDMYSNTETCPKCGLTGAVTYTYTIRSNVCNGYN